MSLQKLFVRIKERKTCEGRCQSLAGNASILCDPLLKGAYKKAAAVFILFERENPLPFQRQALSSDEPDMDGGACPLSFFLHFLRQFFKCHLGKHFTL